MKDAKHWQKKIKECLKGEITGKELTHEAESHLVDNGFIEHDVLGWVKREDIDEAGIKGGVEGVPVTGQGNKRKITPEFLEYQSRKKKEAYGKAQRTLNKITEELSNKFEEI